MNVYWLLCKVFTLTNQAGEVRYTTTMDRIDWEPWTYTNEDGVSSTVKFPVPRYPYAKSFAYNESEPPYTVALARVEVPDGVTPTIQTGDRVMVINTAAKWSQLASTYPNLVGRFADQPTA